MGDPFKKESRRGPFELKPQPNERVLGRRIPASGPADPRQHVGNAKRSPEPYLDLRTRPNLTGTYFDERGRYRLFINHAGGHLECLLTLVVKTFVYHGPRGGKDTLANDMRLPVDWGINPKVAAMKHGLPPIAFRFAGDATGAGDYRLYVPTWIGEFFVPTATEAGPDYTVGALEPNGSGDELTLTFLPHFVSRWPSEPKGMVPEFASGEVRTTAVRKRWHPVLLERYLARASVPFEMRTQFWFSLTPQQQDRTTEFASALWRVKVHVNPQTFQLDASGEAMDVYDIVLGARKLGNRYPETLWRDNAVTAIDKIVGLVFQAPIDEPIETGGMGQADLPALRVWALRILDGWFLPEDDDYPRQSLSASLSRIVDRAGSGATRKNLERHLGISPRGWRKFNYSIKVELFSLLDFLDPAAKEKIEAGEEIVEKARELIEKRFKEAMEKVRKYTKYLPSAYMVGIATVRFEGSEGGEEPENEPWEASYGLSLAGLTRSWGDGAPGFKLEGKHSEWGATPPNPKDLEGVLTYSELGGMLNLLPSAISEYVDAPDLSAGKSMLTFIGHTQEPGLAFFFDPEKQESGKGAGLGSMAGYSWLLVGKGGDVVLEEEADDNEFENYWVQRIPSLAVHFPINGARLPEPTDEEQAVMDQFGIPSVKQALDAFAACELPLLAHPLMKLTLTGHADLPDNRERNDELSGNRAESVYNYLHGVLGNTLSLGLSTERLAGAELSRVELLGEGESEAEKHRPSSGSAKEDYDPSYRRVDVEVAIKSTPDDETTSTRWNLLRTYSLYDLLEVFRR